MSSSLPALEPGRESSKGLIVLDSDSQLDLLDEYAESAGEAGD